MKRLATILFLLFFILLPHARPAQAQGGCGKYPVLGPNSAPCPAGLSRCGASAVDYCCANTADCTTAKKQAETQKQSTQLAEICGFIQGPEKSKCQACFEKGSSWTALGCISTDPGEFAGLLLNFGVGIAGGVAFLLVLFGGFQILTSAGNPEQLNAGRELITSAIAGLLIIIFSVFLLRLIGVDILAIPGFK